MAEDKRQITTERNYHIDILKLIASMLVVLIHVVDHTTGRLFWRPVLDLAVPIFFMITGYLVLHRSMDYIKNYVKTLLKVYVTVGLFYWVGNFIIINMTQGVRYTISNYIKAYILGELVSWENISAGIVGQYHLWYIWASIIGIIIFMNLKKLNLPDWLMVAIGFTGYMISLSNPNSYIVSGGFPKAFFFLAVGYLLYNRTQVSTDKRRWSLLPVFVLLILILPFTRLLTMYHINTISISLVSIGLVYMAVTTYLPKNKLSLWSSRVSGDTYLYHPFILYSLVFIGSFEPGEGWNRTTSWGTVVLFILTYIGTLLFIQLTQYIQKQTTHYLAKDK